ncbi:hypothetical protein JST97_26655 [bacterium]|nr:hypothetical protein [bacterium]
MRNRRGVVIVTVLFFILLIGILSRAILYNGALMARVGGQLGQELLAQRAAEAGAAYCRAQIKDKNDWKGNKNTTTVNLPDLKVVEDNGNVIGWMKNAAGEVSVFRIRFNYYDGSGGADGLADPALVNQFDCPYISVNNISAGGPATVPRADSTSPWAVSSPTVGTSLDPTKAIVEIEGISGQGVSQMTGPGPLGNGSVLKRTLRVAYSAAGSTAAPDSAISGGNGIFIEAANAVKVSVVGPGTARMRTKKAVDVASPGTPPTVNILNMNGDVGADTSTPVTGGLNATLTGTVTTHDEHLGDSSDFHNLKWADVAKASTSPSAAVQLPGGIYVTGLDGKIRYYDKDPSQFKTLDQSAGCVTLSPDFREVRTDTLGTGIDTDTTTFAVNVTKDLNVNTSTGGVGDIMFCPPSGREINENDTAKPYVSTTSYSLWTPGLLNIGTGAKFSCAGNIIITTDVHSKGGSITAGGNATICAPSVVLDAAGATPLPSAEKLSVYAKQDLTLSTWMNSPGYPPYVPPIKMYGPLNIKGLVYSWGDANIYAATPGKPEPPAAYGSVVYGTVDLRGALVSYGADPVTGKPGSAGNGKVSIFGRDADIKYDTTYLVAGTTITPGNPLDSIKRVGYGFER